MLINIFTKALKKKKAFLILTYIMKGKKRSSHILHRNTCCDRQSAKMINKVVDGRYLSCKIWIGAVTGSREALFGM